MTYALPNEAYCSLANHDTKQVMVQLWTDKTSNFSDIRINHIAHRSFDIEKMTKKRKRLFRVSLQGLRRLTWPKRFCFLSRLSPPPPPPPIFTEHCSTSLITIKFLNDLKHKT